MSSIFQKRVIADVNQMIHLSIPKELGSEVEVFVLPKHQAFKSEDEGLAMLSLFESTAFVRDVLNNPEEDCWNDL